MTWPSTPETQAFLQTLYPLGMWATLAQCGPIGCFVVGRLGSGSNRDLTSQDLEIMLSMCPAFFQAQRTTIDDLGDARDIVLIGQGIEVMLPPEPCCTFYSTLQGL